MSPANGPFYVGVDVGTGSARACIIDSTGEILAVAAKDIQRWNPKPDFYVRLFVFCAYQSLPIGFDFANMPFSFFAESILRRHLGRVLLLGQKGSRRLWRAKVSS